MAQTSTQIAHQLMLSTTIRTLGRGHFEVVSVEPDDNDNTQFFLLVQCPDDAPDSPRRFSIAVTETADAHS